MTRKTFFLLADDDRDDIELLEGCVKSIDNTIIFKAVQDGRKAVAFLQSCPEDNLPTTIILDYNMPHINGPGMLDWLCDDTRYNGIHKFVWSTAFQEEYVTACMEKGAIQYFVKPITMEGVEEIARTIIAVSKESA